MVYLDYLQIYRTINKSILFITFTFYGKKKHHVRAKEKVQTLSQDKEATRSQARSLVG